MRLVAEMLESGWGCEANVSIHPLPVQATPLLSCPRGRVIVASAVVTLNAAQSLYETGHPSLFATDPQGELLVVAIRARGDVVAGRVSGQASPRS